MKNLFDSLRFAALRNRETGLCLLVVVGMALLAAAPFVLRDSIPLDTRGVFSLSPWQEAAPLDYAPDSGTPASRAALRYYAWSRFMHESAMNDDSLLWNPYEDTGSPFLAVWRTRCMSPFSLPLYMAASLPRALQIALFLRILAAGVVAFAAARLLGVHRTMALVAAVAFQMSALFVAGPEDPISDVYPWLPFVFVFVDRMARGFVRVWPWGAVLFALMLLGGAPEAVFSVMFFGGLVLVVRLFMLRLKPLRLAADFGIYFGVCVVACFCAAIQILPYLGILSETVMNTDPASHGFGAGTLIAAISPTYFKTQFFPEAVRLIGVPVLAALLPLYLALRRFVPDLNRQRNDAMLLVTAVVWLPAWLITATGLGEALPFLALDNLILPNAFVVAYTAANGAQHWTALNADSADAAVKRFLLYFPAVLLAGALFFFMAHDSLERASLLQWFIMPAAALVLMFAVLAVTLFRPHLRFLAIALTALVAGQACAVYFGHPWFRGTPAGQVFPDTKLVTALRASEGRVGTMQGDASWPLAGSGIAQIHSADGIQLVRHAAFMEQLENDPLLIGRMGAGTLLLTKEAIQTVFAPARPRLHVEHVFASGAVLFQDVGLESRARVIETWRTAEHFEPENLSADQPPLVEHRLELPAQAGGERTAAIVDEHNTEVHVQADSPQGGILVLSDAWTPAWQATIDGEDAAVFAVDGLFRGVALTPGAHDVNFHYRPFSYTLGKWVSFVAGLAVLGGIVFWLYQIVCERKERAARGW